MCGIVGILGRGPVAEQLVDSLKRLEYRGYDSAGVATLEGDHLDRRRAEGKLKNLEARLKAAPLTGHTGIGHTRWATHGKPTEGNAHPHATDNVAVVHNGIIENFRELRQALEKQGAKFTSETDTEVVAHLVNSHLLKGASPQEAVKDWSAIASFSVCQSGRGNASESPRRKSAWEESAGTAVPGALKDQIASGLTPSSRSLAASRSARCRSSSAR